MWVGLPYRNRRRTLYGSREHAAACTKYLRCGAVAVLCNYCMQGPSIGCSKERREGSERAARGQRTAASGVRAAERQWKARCRRAFGIWDFGNNSMRFCTSALSLHVQPRFQLPCSSSSTSYSHDHRSPTVRRGCERDPPPLQPRDRLPSILARTLASKVLRILRGYSLYAESQGHALAEGLHLPAAPRP